jgi:hypothetical protein
LLQNVNLESEEGCAMTQGTSNRPTIDTVPLPDRPIGAMKVPVELATEFKDDLRIVSKHWVWGIPVPDRFLDERFSKMMGKDMEVFLVPRENL